MSQKEVMVVMVMAPETFKTKLPPPLIAFFAVFAAQIVHRYINIAFFIRSRSSRYGIDYCDAVSKMSIKTEFYRESLILNKKMIRR